MNDSDHRDEIVRLEAQIDELGAGIESSKTHMPWCLYGEIYINCIHAVTLYR